jgi:NAD+ diphosphatase
MSPSSDSFLSPCHLPFNQTCLQQHFHLATPDADPGGEEGVWVVLRGVDLLLCHSAGGALPRGPLPPTLVDGGNRPLFIGNWQENPCRVLYLPETAPLPAGWMAEKLPDWHSRIPIGPLTLAGTALQILHWERTSAFCPVCGKPTERLPGEWGKRCPACGYAHFPHIHPCAITLVRRPGEVLLVRKAEWPPGRYSLVSGFVEFGECLEEAAVREVEEETGVQIGDPRYVGSQCWPFPSQLMAGFVADYEGGELRVDRQELEDARWFPVDRLPALPPPRSISRYLLDRHLTG